MKLNSYKELIVWQKSIQLVEGIYQITNSFPKEEQFGIVAQIRRAAVSVPSNIAEGFGRKSHKEYLQFYAIAYGSSLEVETQLIISRKLGFISEQSFNQIEDILQEVMKMLCTMVYGRKEQKQREHHSLL